jgi:hypothetical protein
MLCAAMVHPDQSEVFVVGTEPIQRQDGDDKNDCERSAMKRLLSWMSTIYKNNKLLFLADSLYSTGPNIKQIRANNWDFILGVKPDGNKHLFTIFNSGIHRGKQIPVYTYKEDGETIELAFFNDASINESHPDERVNFLHCKKTNKKGKVTMFSWVTSLPITRHNMLKLMKAGRARWKIENETFNTLKNQGYRFEHNYGHGHEHLSSVFSHIMFFAFLTDQIIQHSYRLFGLILEVTLTKSKVWLMLRASFLMRRYSTMTDIYSDIGAGFSVNMT